MLASHDFLEYTTIVACRPGELPVRNLENFQMRDDFDERFQRMSRGIERNAKRMVIVSGFAWLVSACLSLGILVFLGWVIIKVMAHFGVL